MSKQLLIIVLFVFLTLFAGIKPPKQFVSTGFFWGPEYDLYKPVLTEWNLFSGTRNNLKPDKTKAIGPLFAHYEYHFSGKNALGLFAGYYYNKYRISTDGDLYDQSTHFLIFLITAQKKHLQRKDISIYSRFGIGYQFFNINYKTLEVYGNYKVDKPAHFAFEFVPVGIKFGKKTSIFLETSFGLVYLFKTGLSFQI